MHMWHGCGRGKGRERGRGGGERTPDRVVRFRTTCLYLGGLVYNNHIVQPTSMKGKRVAQMSTSILLYVPSFFFKFFSEYLPQVLL